jgi:hypothetical protein
MQEGVRSISDSLFINTSYSFNTAVKSTYKYALDLIRKEGGKVTDRKISIKSQVPSATILETAFPNTVFDSRISVFDKGGWTFKGNWKTRETTRNETVTKQAIYSDSPGDAAEIKFTGTGISITGNWFKDGGKADVFVDGNLHRSIDTYYFFANQQHTESIWHVMNLQQGEHIVRVVVKGEARPESEGTRVAITGATIFRTEPKKSDNYKFSFQL